ncbi:MAG: hypothetical protein IPG96_00095 [Proteobacteria bacterium]|nr:hypothetical protein [Pseudomonadota bacterium]
MFIGLAPRDGVIELAYRRLPVDVIGPALTLLACLGAALMLLHRDPRAIRVSPTLLGATAGGQEDPPS